MTALILGTIIFIYIVAIALLIHGFNKVNYFDHSSLTPVPKDVVTKFTIIVPFRNEAHNLPSLLESFAKLNYPAHLFEVILVDDESEDRFATEKTEYKIQIIKNKRVSNSPKKDAITIAMQYVTSDWVITTDADCVVPKNWLLTLNNYIQRNNVAMISAAVAYQCADSFIHHFQQLDLASLQGATIGSFGIKKAFMCNGANFAYTKSIFEKLNGFTGNDKIASGDDVFLLQKAVERFPEQVHYLKSNAVIVTTKPLNDWKSLFYQRVRWASKTSSYQSAFGKSLGLLVFAGNLSIITSLGLVFIGYLSWITLLMLALTKFIFDTILISKANNFMTSTKMRYLILSSFLYPFFSVGVALYSLSGKYEWKGRRF
ncbi:MAG: glycosyltransferase [Flavobacterium micromati]|nr:glycosyltransferase [Flavobacterium micromati]